MLITNLWRRKKIGFLRSIFLIEFWTNENLLLYPKQTDVKKNSTLKSAEIMCCLETTSWENGIKLFITLKYSPSNIALQAGKYV